MTWSYDRPLLRLVHPISCQPPEEENIFVREKNHFRAFVLTLNIYSLKKINKQRFIVYTKFYNSYGLNDTIDVSKISNPKVKCKLY